MLRPRLLVLAALPLLAYAAKRPVTIEAVVTAPPPPHGSITWAPEGERFIVNERGTLSLYDVKSGKEREIIALDKLENAAVKSPAPAVFDWTNRHVAETTIQWFSDGRRLLVSSAGDLFIVDVNKRSFEPLLQTPDAER